MSYATSLRATPQLMASVSARVSILRPTRRIWTAPTNCRNMAAVPGASVPREKQHGRDDKLVYRTGLSPGSSATWQTCSLLGHPVCSNGFRSRTLDAGSGAAGVVTEDFILRLPLDDFWPSVHLAPYIFGGGTGATTPAFNDGLWRLLQLLI
jgi:hypothetical protein